MTKTGNTMRASALVDVGRIETRTVDRPVPDDRDVLVRIAACGICGSDFHIFTGEGNWNLDRAGRPVPLAIQPQILGHEMTGTVQEVGSAVEDLKVGVLGPLRGLYISSHRDENGHKTA